jgi:formate-dependent nitrite reductase membrane component NrfD
MTPIAAAAEHFAGAPEWTWYILFYFFFAGLAGGCYFLATLLRHRGAPEDEPAARLGFYVALPATVICPILLTLDLKKPLRFWHMLVNTTPGSVGLEFRTGTPMSVGAWALLIAGVFALVSFLDTLVRDGRLRWAPARGMARVLDGTVGLVWNVVGAAVFFFVAAYTGVLLAVSNQPEWSDTWALGGLFLASGLSGSVALLLLLARYRPAAAASRAVLETAGRLFAALELLLLVVFALTLVDDHALDTAFGFPWLLLWLVALAGMAPALGDLAVGRLRANGAAERTAAWALLVPWLVLAGVLALRAAVIFSAQA